MNPLCQVRTVVLFLAAAATATSSARAGAPVVPSGKSARVVNETAVILWNKAEGTQHLFLRGSFLTDAAEIGFLIPTPSKPEIESADARVFDILERATAGKIIEQVVPHDQLPYHSGVTAETRAFPGSPASASVTVIERKRVGHLDATVLRADDADALNAWLAKHGYATPRELTAWLDHYVRRQWTVTAFKLAKDPSASPDGVAGTGIRLSFKTEDPRAFYPYREPEDQRTAPSAFRTPRLFRVYVVSADQVRGEFPEVARGFSAHVVHSGPLQPALRTHLLDTLKLPGSAIPSPAWVTEFEDHSYPRQGDADLYLSPEAAPFTVARSPEIRFVAAAPPPPPNPARSFTVVAGVAGGIVALLLLSALVFWRGEVPAGTAG